MVDEVNVPGSTASLDGMGDAAAGAADKFDHLNDVAQRTQSNLNGLNRFADMTQSIFSRIDSEIKKVGVSLNVSGSLTSRQTEQFSLLSTAVLGSRVAFEGLGGINSSGLNTFTGQVNDLFSILSSKGTAPELVASAAIKMKNSLLSMGAPTNDVNKAFGSGVEVLTAYARHFLNSADNALRLQNAVIGLAGRTGELNEVFRLSGPNLNNINALLEKHSKIMSDAAMATGAPIKQVEAYYGQLGTIPGALSSIVGSSGNADKSLSMLTATMKVAAGTGRSVEEVTQDMRTAFRDYGITGESAIKFSTRISEVTNNLGIELDVVKAALTDTANTFKMFAGTQEQAARMSEGFAKTLNSYSQALMSTGMNGNQAVDVIQNMTKQIGNLSIAQKSFLSSQTGGPGGLMGAFQIDKMMREGKVDEVFEKVRQQMMKQFGTLVTVDEAAKSPAAAAQMTRQMQMLKQGPLGQFARNDVEAERILEGFKARNEGRVSEKGLSDKIVQESMDKGTSIQEKSFTVLNEINANLEGIRMNANIGNLGMAQKSLTAGMGVGSVGGLSLPQIENKTNLKNAMKSGAVMNESDRSSSLNNTVVTGELKSSIGKDAVKAVGGVQNTIKNIGSAIKAPIEVMKDTFSSERMPDVEKNKMFLNEDIKNRKTNKNEVLNKAMDLGGASNENIVPGNRIGTLVKNVASRNVAQTPTAEANAIKNNTNATAENTKTDINVHVTGYCLNCKREMDNGSQMNGMNPAAKI